MVTACFLWALRGQRQTSLQWNVLLTIALGMSAFLLADDASSSGEVGFKPFGFVVVLTKVFFSCLCAVILEKYLKEFKDIPLYAQVAQLKVAWMLASLVLAGTFDQVVVEKGFFYGWDRRTMMVQLSWVCKGWTSFLVLRELDSVLKNLGEALAIIVIYAFEVALANYSAEADGSAFRLEKLLIVLVVVLTISSYSMACSMTRRSGPGT